MEKFTLDYPHQKIHDGLSFVVTSYDSDVDIAGPKYYRLAVPSAAPAPHLVVALNALAACTGELFETPTLTGMGTALVPVNRNRNSSNAAALVVAEDPTISAAGTSMGLCRIPGAANPGVFIGGILTDRQEFILAPGKTYLFKILTDADNNKTWVSFNWYE